MASVQFYTLKGQPQRVFPVHDLGNGISYDQALRATNTNAMQNELHILGRTAGNLPFPDKIPKYIAAKVERHLREMQADEVANAELEARLYDSLHNEVEEEQRRQEAMAKAQEKTSTFQSISDLGLDSMSDERNELNPFSPEGMAHLDWKSRQMHGAPFQTMREMLKRGQIQSQFKADQLMEQVEKEASAAAKKRVEESGPFASLLPSPLQFLQLGTPISVASTPPKSPQSPATFTAIPIASALKARVQQALSKRRQMSSDEKTQQQAKEKQMKKKQSKKRQSGAGAGKPVAAPSTTGVGRRTKQPESLEDYI
jgi:hypothetical protein